MTTPVTTPDMPPTDAATSAVPAPVHGGRPTGRPLSRSFPAAVFGGLTAVAVVLGLLTDLNVVLLVLLVSVVGTAVVVGVSRRVEGRRTATDRFVTCLVYGAFGLAMVPLVSLVWTVLSKGLTRLDGEFFGSSMLGVVGPGGGAYHAIMGTLIITGITALMSVPIGLLTSIYLVEYGRGRLAKAITFLVDVMTGIPSIVSGLFAYALFALFFGPGTYSGFAGSVALSVLMVPVVVRSSEEVLKLVPNELREAAYALGVPRWRTIVKVVLPTALAGLGTAVTLAIARVIGETAPLLVTAGYTTVTNVDPFHNQMVSLPVYAYIQLTSPGVPPENGINRAWAAALVLIVIVLALNLLARLISRIFAPKTGR